MKHQALLIILATVGIIILAGGIWWFARSKKEVSSPVIPGSPETFPTTVKSKLLTWNDPAGFTFQYSSELSINNHPEDQVNYANLEITASGKTGSILIMASDTKLKKIVDWEKTQTKSSAATLGGKEAKEISLSTGETAIGSIDSAILFTIKMTPGNDSVFWQKNYDKIISSFGFWYPTPAQSSSGGGGGSSDIIEEEEIIE